MRKSPPGMPTPNGASPMHGRRRSIGPRKTRRGKGKRSKGNLRAKAHQGHSLLDLLRIRMPALTDLSPSPNLKPKHVCPTDSSSQWCLQSPSPAGDVQHELRRIHAQLPNRRRRSLLSSLANAHRKIALYGHDAKKMKQFTCLGSEKHGFQWRRVRVMSIMLKHKTTL